MNAADYHKHSVSFYIPYLMKRITVVKLKTFHYIV